MKKTIIKTFDEFQDWWRNNKSPIVAFDSETTSLNYLEMGLVGFSFCNGESAIYVDLSSECNNLYTRKWIIDSLRYSIPKVTLVMHNAAFDLKVLDRCGINPPNIFCTLIGSQLLNENLYSHGLKYLAEHWLKIPPDQIKKWGEVSADVTSKEFMDYAMNDAIWAYQLYEIESKALKKQGLEHLFYSVEMPFQYVLRDLEINGVAVDREEYESAKKDLSELLEEALIETCKAGKVKYWYDKDLFENEVLCTEINFNSRQQLVKLVEKTLGFEITEWTKPSKTYPKGQKSFGKKTKALFKNKHLFFTCFAKYDELKSLLSSFMIPLEKYIDPDGRVRTSYGILVTGRLSSSKPHLQNQPNPKKKKLIYNYRKIFVPGD